MSDIWNPPKGTFIYLASVAGEVSCIEIKSVLIEGQSRFQKYAILDTIPYGRILVLDGVIQSAVYDEWMYHESFVIPPMCGHPGPRRVAVLGGGEGAMLREVLRHPSVESVVMVDIDDEVVAACREHLPTYHQGAFDDPRVTLVTDDARAWLERQERPEFDVVLVDLTEPLSGGPAVKLFTREFYDLVRRSSSTGGVVALQAGSIRPSLSWAYACVVNTLSTVFPCVRPYSCWITSFAEAWGFALAGDASLQGLDGALIDRRSADRGITPHFLDGETFEGLLRLPLPVRRDLESIETVATDDRPLALTRS
jgi:spermidine synthase